MVSPMTFAQMKVESPKKGAIRREALSSVPMLVIPPRNTIRRTNRSSPRDKPVDAEGLFWDWDTKPAGRVGRGDTYPARGSFE